jgi:hypothetical protein
MLAIALLSGLCMQISFIARLNLSPYSLGSWYPEQLLTAGRKYLALTPRTRIIIGLGVMAYAGAALYLSDRAEDTFNLKATEEEKKRLHEMIPKIRSIDRPEST